MASVDYGCASVSTVKDCVDHRRLERDRRGDREAARARARAPSWSSSPVARSCCAELADSLALSGDRGAVDLTNPDAPERIRAHLERALSAASTCSSTTPGPPGGAVSPRAATTTSTAIWSSTSMPSCGSPRHSCRCCAPRRRARSSTSPAPPVGSRRPRTGAYSASKFALIGWTDALLRRGASKRRPRRPRPARFHRHRRLPCDRAAREGADPLDRLQPRGRSRGNSAGWPRR